MADIDNPPAATPPMSRLPIAARPQDRNGEKPPGDKFGPCRATGMGHVLRLDAPGPVFGSPHDGPEDLQLVVTLGFLRSE